MPQRSEPQILADLIRLHTRLEADADRLRLCLPLDSALIANKHEQAELIEQARAALHRYVIAKGKAMNAERPIVPRGMLLPYIVGSLFFVALHFLIHSGALS